MTGAGWAGRRVLVTGHTGFKGGWLCLWLQMLGAEVAGLALPPNDPGGIYTAADVGRDVVEFIGDIRLPATTREAVVSFDPDVVFHLAAQPLVREGYANPVTTWDTNVMGTVHLMESLRRAPSLRAVVVATTDKVYANDGRGLPFTESDRLGGHDPYSASKAGTELVVSSYRDAFFTGGLVAMATARAGNVIGGGDTAVDRLIPDAIRAIAAGTELVLRNPTHRRPWQFVLDALGGYLALAEALLNGDAPAAVNFGPGEGGAEKVSDVIDAIVSEIGRGSWRVEAVTDAPEAPVLRLATELAVDTLGWRSRVTLAEGIARTVAWHRVMGEGGDVRAHSQEQIRSYMELHA